MITQTDVLRIPHGADSTILSSTVVGIRQVLQFQLANLRAGVLRR